MNQDDKVRLSVEIFGTTYKMIGSFSEQYMKQIAAYVNENMASIAKSNPRLDTKKVAVLALVHMADEYFQLRAKWDAIEGERSQSRQHIEELRKAFELSEEKERSKSNEVRHLMERIAVLEKENTRIAEESELASLVWAEQVEEWETKHAAAVQEAEAAQRELEARIEELQRHHEEVVRQLQDAAAVNTAERKAEGHSGPAAEGPAISADSTLLEKYKKLQEEYTKLQNEFNEWIQLTQSETQ